jgi:DNA modification methylase
MAHPAKMAIGLCQRIFEFMESEGMLKEGETVVDPFGGVFTTGLVGANRRFQVVGVELEEKFYRLARANIEKHATMWNQTGRPLPFIFKGDSRRLSMIIDQYASSIITSPPFLPGARAGGNLDDHQSHTYQKKLFHSEASIDHLKEGNIDGVLTSPPYSDIAAGAGGLNTKPQKNGKGQSGRSASSPSQKADQRYGSTPGQISKLKDAIITSPPYADSINSERHGIDFNKAKKDYPGRVQHKERVDAMAKRHEEMNYGKTEAQIGALHDKGIDGILTSPTYEGMLSDQRDSRGPGQTSMHDKRKQGERYTARGATSTAGYGADEQQIGKEKGETYWQAMHQVYSECFKVLKPGGWAAIVVKDFIRNKERVPLCDNTVLLLEHIGFVVRYRVRAHLVDDLGTADAFTGMTKRRERKSFFRRLYEQKYPENRIDYEEVLFARKVVA